MPDLNLILPNGCEDGEANCQPVNNRYTQFDDFLAQQVPKIEASPAFGPNGVIVVVYDEDERAGGMAAKNGFGQGGHVVCAILSPLAVPGAYGGTLTTTACCGRSRTASGCQAMSATPTM